MHLDMSIWPTTLDAGHALLAGLVLVLLIFQVLLLTAGIVALLRRGREAQPAEIGNAQPAATPGVPEKSEPMVGIAPSPLREAVPDSALQLLSLLQNEARFIDFVQENVTGYSDADIGAAARIVHEGCRKVIHQHFDLQPVRKEAESSRVTLPKGFDAASVRLTGNIVGQAPFSGTLVHRGWRAMQVKLPKLAESHDTRIIAPAEVEL
jgi:hypothetical protein